MQFKCYDPQFSPIKPQPSPELHEWVPAFKCLVWHLSVQGHSRLCIRKDNIKALKFRTPFHIINMFWATSPWWIVEPLRWVGQRTMAPTLPPLQCLSNSARRTSAHTSSSSPLTAPLQSVPRRLQPFVSAHPSRTTLYVMKSSGKEGACISMHIYLIHTSWNNMGTETQLAFEIHTCLNSAMQLANWKENE